MTQHRGRIVVGVDGSAESLEALRWAVHQADLTGAQTEAVISWDYPTAYGSAPMAGDFDWAANAKVALDDAVELAVGPAGAAVTRDVVQGHPARILLERSAGADLLVVGSRGHGGFAGLLLGSVSDHVVAHAPCPVVVVRHAPPA